jgi:hypothetical protein
MPRIKHYPVLKGIRMTMQDAAKLDALAMATQQPPSDVLRWLIRTAQPSDAALFLLKPNKRKTVKN